MSETESAPPTPPSTPTPPSDTPIGDELASRQTVEPDPASTEDFDEAEEIKRALARETHDGKGDEDPGESDWVSYATDGVEVDD